MPDLYLSKKKRKKNNQGGIFDRVHQNHQLVMDLIEGNVMFQARPADGNVFPHWEDLDEVVKTSSNVLESDTCGPQ